MYTVRPILRLSEDAVHGTVRGFIGVDLAQPLYCLGDGVINHWTYVKFFFQYLITFDPDVLVNVFDVAFPLLEKCNPINTIGGLGAVSLALYK